MGPKDSTEEENPTKRLLSDINKICSIVSLPELTNPEENLACSKSQTTENASPPPEKPRLFECQECKKVFNTYQALGGHKASHNYKKAMIRDSNCGGVHECLKCHVVFATGQALGGHMRRHYQGPLKNNTNNNKKKKKNDDNYSNVNSNNDVGLDLSLRIGFGSNNSQIQNGVVRLFGVDIIRSKGVTAEQVDLLCREDIEDAITAPTKEDDEK